MIEWEQIYSSLLKERHFDPLWLMHSKKEGQCVSITDISPPTLVNVVHINPFSDMRWEFIMLRELVSTFMQLKQRQCWKTEMWLWLTVEILKLMMTKNSRLLQSFVLIRWFQKLNFLILPLIILCYTLTIM